MSSVTVSIPLTAGEFIQGSYQGSPCLISCPINSYHTASVTLLDTDDWILPQNARKTITALQMGMKMISGDQPGGILELSSPAPRERGYGTSTADISACLYAYSAASGDVFHPTTVAEIAVSIEPSDSSFFPGLCLFDHRKGQRIEHLGPTPPLKIILMDPGGQINTIDFNQQDFFSVLDALSDLHREIFDQFISGLFREDWEMIGEATTRSAEIHQDILFSPLMEKSIQLAADTSAIGICRAHSGTLIGFLYPPSELDIIGKQTYIQDQFAKSINIQSYQCVDGGPQFDPEIQRLRSEDEIG